LTLELDLTITVNSKPYPWWKLGWENWEPLTAKGLKLLNSDFPIDKLHQVKISVQKEMLYSIQF